MLLLLCRVSRALFRFLGVENDFYVGGCDDANHADDGGRGGGGGAAAYVSRVDT